MQIHLLSPYPDRLAPIILAAGDTLSPLPDVDWIVSYGHREILREPFLSRYPNRILNLHISLLPWNRGADPNYWSWREDTPKGVTIHLIDAGIDTGPIIAQRELTNFTRHDNLKTTYACLQAEVVALFAATWPCIRANDFTPHPSGPGGSFHRMADKPIVDLNTPVHSLRDQSHVEYDD